tara:strand:+ start:405 stop:776 length:372 start_codon:yes stop_codon:yes gene_type:complete
MKKNKYLFVLENQISLSEDIPLDDKLREKARLTLQRTRWTLQDLLKTNEEKLARAMAKKPKNPKDESEHFDRLCRHGYLRGVINGLKDSIYEIQKQTDDLNAGFYNMNKDVETRRLNALNKKA